MARKTKQEAQETRQHILDVALRLFSQQGVSSTSLGEIAKAAGVTRGAIYWHFKDKSDLFSEIWELSESNIGELELEYQAKFPGDPLSVLREILIHVLESTVTEERRRLLMEIIFHKCEFVGEIASVQLVERSLCLENYDRIEKTLRHCMDVNMLPENLNTRRVAVLMRSYISGIMENWLFAPESFDLKNEARQYVAVLLELRARHIKVPEQVKLASFYDSELLTSSTPQISAAQFDGERLGATACRMLLDILAGKQIALRQMQGYQVILRESTK